MIGNMKVVLKIFKEIYSFIKVIFFGIRRYDLFFDVLRIFLSIDLGWFYYMRVNLILDWYYFDVWFVIRECNIFYCFFYD